MLASNYSLKTGGATRDRAPVVVEIDATDADGNIMPTYRYSFNEPIFDNTPPYVSDSSPYPNEKNVPLDAVVSINIRDPKHERFVVHKLFYILLTVNFIYSFFYY